MLRLASSKNASFTGDFTLVSGKIGGLGLTDAMGEVRDARDEFSGLMAIPYGSGYSFNILEDVILFPGVPGTTPYGSG